LNRLACDLAIYRLQSLRPLHDLADARRRYDDAIAMLTKVAGGEMTLGVGVDGGETSIAQDGEQIVGSKRVFNRKTLKGF
jgi:phage gp36-like protein